MAKKKGYTWLSYVLILVGLAYFLIPIDIVPDAPIVGWIDDLIINIITIALAQKVKK